MPADVGYHSKVPQYEDQRRMTDNCEFTDGVCYYDGSTMHADKVFDILTEEGSEGVWKYLESYYWETLG